MIIFRSLIFMIYLLGAYGTIQSIAHRCAMILQSPGGNDSFEMFYSEFKQNCLEYYSVKVNTSMVDTIKRDYNAVINASLEYEISYGQNERLLYQIQAWINMVISDPLASAQRQMKECNSQLLVNTFNLDDMQNTLPIFIKGQDYMNECFLNAKDRIESMKTDIENDCIDQIKHAKEAAEDLTSKYNTLTLQQYKLTALQPVLQRHIVDMNPADI